MHLTPNGSTYTATKEEFVTGGPLPVSDAIIGKDGAMYFTIGGRRVQSGLYRVSYVGSDWSDKSDKSDSSDIDVADRRTLEAFHGKQDPKAVSTAWPHVSSSDRYIRAAARTALEHQPLAEWQDKALGETNVT
ncbi:MAG: heme-binding protein, partial [Prosthecobacter sp.]